MGMTSGDKGKAAFGVFIDDSLSFGIMFKIPTGEFFPFPCPLGTMDIQCTAHSSSGHYGVVCGVDYEAPAWAAAVYKEGKLVIGEVKRSMSDAVSDMKEGWADFTGWAE